MKKTILFLNLIMLTAMLTGCFNERNSIVPSKTQITKKYSVSPFNKIESNVVANIIFVQDSTTAVEAKGPENYIPHIVVSSKDSTLRIKMDNERTKFSSLRGNKVEIRVYAPELISLVHKGVGDVILQGTIQVADLTVNSSGVGNVKSDALEGNHIKVYSTGVGNVVLKGKANSAYYESKGVGNLNAKEMIVSDATVEQKGVGNVSCYASGKINITSKGVGNVEYYGNPEVTGLNKAGVGSVKSK